MSKGIRVTIIVAVLLLAYPAGAWLIGVIVEGQLQRREAEAVERAPYLVLIQRTYQRGVYGATEELTYNLRGPFARALGVAPVANTSPSLRLKVRNTIHHGPLPQLRAVALATIDSELVLPSELRVSLDPVLAGRPIVTGHTRMGWFGGSKVLLTSPPFEAQLSQGGTVSWRGISATADFAAGHRSWTADVAAQGFRLRSEKLKVEFDDLRVHTAMRRLLTELDIGTSTARLARLDIQTAAAGSAVSLRQIALDGTSSINDDYVDSKLAATIGTLNAGAFSASSLGYAAAIDHLQAQALDTLTRDMRAAARDIYGDGVAGSVAGRRTSFNSSSTLNPSQKMLDVLRKDGIELLLHDPVVDISRVGFVTPDGQFSLSVGLKAPGLNREDFKGPVPATLAALSRHVDLVADLRADTALIDKLLANSASHDRLSAQIAGLENQGFLKREGSTFTSHIVFRAGSLSVNGQSLPPRPAG
jgi:uncharacterized protein YdgA (DUF945 family)